MTNDSYRTDVLLLYPPYLVALTCLYMACVHCGRDVTSWYQRLNVNIDEIHEITRAMLLLYRSYVPLEGSEQTKLIQVHVKMHYPSLHRFLTLIILFPPRARL